MYVDQTQAGVIPSSQATAAEDRRRSERVDQCVNAWVSGESTDRSSRGQSVTVTDLSMHGVGFHDAQKHYRPGSTHWLIVNGGPMRMSTRIKVVSCRDVEDGGFQVGAAFF